MITPEMIEQAKKDRLDVLSHTDLIPDPRYPIFEETTVYLRKICHQEQPERILDLGSGMTSVLLRKWNPDAKVVSVENSLDYLKTSNDLLNRYGWVGNGELLLWDVFKHQIDREPFDIVLHDMGDMAFRQKTFFTAMQYVKPGGVMFLDDFGIPVYKEYAMSLLTKHGFRPIHPNSPMMLGVSGAGEFAVFRHGE